MTPEPGPAGTGASSGGECAESARPALGSGGECAESARPALRADAERNRERLIAAAREVFAERGLDVPVEDVARHAGVGVATLYRRFPTRADLIAGAFEAKMAAYADAVAYALAEPDPWVGFCGYIERVCGMQAEDRGFAHVLTMTFPTAQQFESERGRAYHGFLDLVSRAQAAGKLRDDFVGEDLAMLLMASAGVIAGTADVAPDTWRRFAAYMIQAFGAHNSEPLPPPPTPTAMYRALLHLAQAGTRDQRCSS
jgi:AcrR family transcriptional regulator